MPLFRRRVRSLVALLALAFGPPAALTGQVRAIAKPVLAPVAVATLSPLGGAAPLGAAMITAGAESVNVSSTGVGGSVGEAAMTAAIPGAGVPASRLSVRSSAALAAGTYVVAIVFAHGRAGTIQLTVGGASSTCQLSQGGWNATQTCSATFGGGNLDFVAVASAGIQLYPVQVTVSQYR